MKIQSKPSFENFVKTCTPLYNIPELEADIKTRVQRIINDLLDFEPSQNPIENLKEFLQRDKNFLGVVLAMTNLSQEKFLRIISTNRFYEHDYGVEWNINSIYSKLRRDDAFALNIAKLFIEGPQNQLLKGRVADFYLDQLSLPREWHEIIRDQNVIGNLVRKKLTGEYNDLKGDYVEGLIKTKINQISEIYGTTHEHGQVQAMALDKEIDIVLPTLVDPYILIMSSYMETTSSNQTSRANEQNEIHKKIDASNSRYNTSRKFINFVDGAGWLARRSDLLKLYNSCDYIINLNTLDQLEPIIFKYLPRKFFIRQAPPDVGE